MSIQKVKRKKKKYAVIVLIILLLIWILPTICINIGNNILHEESAIKLYSILDVYKNVEKIVELSNRQVIINDDNDVTYENKCQISVKLNNYSEGNESRIVIYNNDKQIHVLENINMQETTMQIELNKEGKQNIKVNIFTNENLDNTYEKTIYYVKSYEKQFLDEKEEQGVSTHFAFGVDGQQSLELVKRLGVKKVRDDCLWKWIIEENNKYNFNRYDKWINECTENGITIIPIMFGPGNYAGSDNKISSQEEVDSYVNFITMFANRYPQILEYEIWNEPNDLYTTEEDIRWYSKAVEEAYKALKEINPEIKIISGATDTSDYAKIDTLIFFENLIKNDGYKYSDGFSYHPYDVKVNDMANSLFYTKLSKHENIINESGGFLYSYITEYGGSTHQPYGMTNEQQAIKLVTQSNILKRYNVKSACIYNVRNYGNNNSVASNNYGILNYDYTPKPAYYTMKNYYENTNGAEYIGTVNLADGLETHVYDKDGKTKIITWSTNTNNTISIPYENFTASDMYGNAIENTDGTLKITSSPVYLDNVSTKYFYEAISNTALQKYAEFEEKFSAELESIDGLQEQINKLKNYMSSIANNKAETQEKSIEMMHEHFYLGTMILDSFNKDKLNVEYVKVSSMLDMLNDIGNSYEDLLTVSATSREAYYRETEKLLNKAETTINNNSDLNILYPSKILDFAKELHDKSKYIIGLEEENDIKTGLIVSNSLHAYYLADWANDFANIYVNKYIKENPVTVSHSNTDEFTNKDLTVTLNIGSDSKVINNEGKNTYTFNKNGTFTFEYERRGQAFKQEITITNIDKEAPIISGIVNGKIYTNSVKPVITDKNLAKVEVLFNGTSIQFNSGNTLKEEGIYNITATDKAGNSTSIEMYIVEKGKDGYVVDGEHILNVRQETKVEQFAKKFNLSTEYTIKRNNNNLLNTDIIATGDILQLKNGSEYTIIVAGDINRDGKVTTYDLSTFRRYILNLREFDKLEEMAADINVDKQELGVKDYTRMRIEILGEY